jgi:hypothetical protein
VRFVEIVAAGSAADTRLRRHGQHRRRRPHCSQPHFPIPFGVARDRLQSTPDRRRRQDEFEEHSRDDTRSAVPDQAAFRIDFPEFLAGLGPRDRTLARFLALGNSAQIAADRFGLSEGRVSQLRKTWREAWCAFQGEAVDGCLGRGLTR